jgi:hypothetical protein
MCISQIIGSLDTNSEGGSSLRPPPKYAPNLTPSPMMVHRHSHLRADHDSLTAVRTWLRPTVAELHAFLARKTRALPLHVNQYGICTYIRPYVKTIRLCSRTASDFRRTGKMAVVEVSKEYVWRLIVLTESLRTNYTCMRTGT